MLNVGCWLSSWWISFWGGVPRMYRKIAGDDVNLCGRKCGKDETQNRPTLYLSERHSTYHGEK